MSDDELVAMHIWAAVILMDETIATWREHLAILDDSGINLGVFDRVRKMCAIDDYRRPKRRERFTEHLQALQKEYGIMPKDDPDYYVLERELIRLAPAAMHKGRITDWD